MGMFIVKEGTKVKCIKDRKEWYPENFVDHVTKQINVFGKEQLRIDPTGIGHDACGPQHKLVIGGAYAEAGYYGFEENGWVMLVPGSQVVYG